MPSPRVVGITLACVLVATTGGCLGLLGGDAPATPADTPEAVTVTGPGTDTPATTPAPATVEGGDRRDGENAATPTTGQDSVRPLPVGHALVPLALPARPFNATVTRRIRATTPNRSVSVDERIAATVGRNLTVIVQTERITVNRSGSPAEQYRYRTETVIGDGNATQRLVFDRPDGTSTRRRTIQNVTGPGFVRGLATTATGAHEMGDFQAVATYQGRTPPEAVYSPGALARREAPLPQMPSTTFQRRSFNASVTTTTRAVRSIRVVERFEPVEAGSGARRPGRALISVRYRVGTATAPARPAWASG